MKLYNLIDDVKELLQIYHNAFDPAYREVKGYDYLYTVDVISRKDDTRERKEVEAYNIDNVAGKLNVDKNDLVYVWKVKI